MPPVRFSSSQSHGVLNNAPDFLTTTTERPRVAGGQCREGMSEYSVREWICIGLTRSHWHESEPLYRRPGTSRILLPGCGRELDDQPGRHPSAVFPVDAVRVGPLADLGGVRPACSRPASAAGRPPGPAPGPAASRDIARASACRSAGACPAVRPVSSPVPSGPTRRCPRPRCRPGRRCPGSVSSGPRMLRPAA